MAGPGSGISKRTAIPAADPGGNWHCTACGGYFLETHGTPLHGKHVAPDLLVWAVGALAEGLGIRAVARVFEVDPNTVLQWLVEAADHLKAFSEYFLHDVHVTQVQLDELYALLSAVKDGEVREAEALKRLSRSSHWVWVALDPVSKLLLTIDVGDRTLAMAQDVVHQVVQVLAPGCVPLFLTDGLKEYATALLAHFGQWVQPPRRQTTGPVPKPRWMPLPQLRYAQVIKVHAPAAPGLRKPSRRVRHPGRRRAGARRAELAHQHGLHRADQSHHPPACSGGRAARHDAVQRGRRLAPATGPLPDLLQFLFAACLLTPELATPRADQWERFGQAVAAPDTRDGRWPDGSRLDVA